jgi:hypothetical protein
VALIVGALALNDGCKATQASQVYVEGAAGYSHIDLQGQAAVNAGGGFGADTAGFNIAVGSYVRPWVGWEVAFLRFGSATESNRGGELEAVSNESLNGAAGEAVFHLPVQAWDAFVKVGVGGLWAAVTAPQQDSRTTSFHHVDLSEFAAAAGIGVQYRFHPQQLSGWTMRTQFDALSGRFSARLASVGVVYAF